MQTQLKNVKRLTDMRTRARVLMVRVMPGTVDDWVASSLGQLAGQAEVLAADAQPDDQLTPRKMVERFEADMLEWTARAYDTLDEPNTAVEFYQRASQLYQRLGNEAGTRRNDGKLAELRQHSDLDIDGETKRRQDQLGNAPPGSLEAADALLALGELHARSGDDIGAVEYLRRAERILLRDENRLADANEMLRLLCESLASTNPSTVRADSSPIERAMKLRELRRRLYRLLAQAQRNTRPDEAAAYHALIEKMDADRLGSPSRERLLDALKTFW